MTSEIIFLFAGLAFGTIGVLALRQRGHNQIHYFESLQKTLTQRMDQITAQMDQRLSENVHAINESKRFVSNQLSSSERTAREVSASLGKLEQTTIALQRTNEEISSFQNMLTHPKVRGGFGEILLANLLSEVLPSDRYKLQYNFTGSGEIADSIILLQDTYIVAVDAKFPLANYQTMVTAKDKEKKMASRKIFIRDVKKHVNDIASKYISPQHKTLDYAFMYIPVEAIYYETMVHDSTNETLWEFCLQNKVIPVSPNSFLAYLQTVLVGLRGMKIEQQTKEILQHLGQVRQDFNQFAKEFTMVGTHLNNAKNRFDDSSRRLDKFANRLDQIENTTHAPKLRQGEKEET